MKKLIFIFTILFSYSICPQQMRLLSSNINIDIPKKNNKVILDPLPAGTYTVGTNGDFPTIDSAFNKLSTDGIAGSVYLELIDTFYTAPTNETGFLLNGPIPGADPNNNISIIHGIEANVTIEGNGKSVLTFMNTSYVTLGYIGPGRYLPGGITIHALYNAQYNRNSCINFINNSDHNVVQNITVIDEDNERTSAGIAFMALNSSPFECPDSNLIFNNFIQKAAWGIYVEGSYGIPRGKGNIIRGNFIGSETDSLIGWGIQLVYCQNTLVESNVVQNLKLTANFGSSGDVMNVGINSYWGSGDIIRNNIVHNVKSNAGYTSTGILLSGSLGESGSNNLIYNNMVYDIQSTSTSTNSRIAGIQMWNQDNPKIYYNSVYLSGTGANNFGSAALYISEICTNIEVKNNILVNIRDEHRYCASSIYDYTISNLISDYNDLYYNTKQYNCMVRISGENNTLEEWRAMGKDLNSVSEMPHFMDGDLHINDSIPTNLESHGTPIIGIDVDFDGDARDSVSTDIGADEFSGTIVGVKDKFSQPSSFALLQNYPNPFNPSTTFRYSIPTESKVVIKVYDILGNEIETLVSEEIQTGTYELTWDAGNLSSGVYFYQIKAGVFVDTKKMIVIK